MLKYLLIGLLIVWLLYSPLLRRARQLHRDRQNANKPAPKGSTAPTENMLACAHCGVHLPASEALRDAAGHPYCCAAHRKAGSVAH